MFLKIVFLFSISAVLTFRLQETPDGLQDYFKDIDRKVKSLQHLTKFQIRTNIVPLGMYIDTARIDVMLNMSAAATPYWAKIRSLEQTAKERGQNISECIDLGNNQIYALNNTIAISTRQAFNYYNESGNKIIDSSYTSTNSVLEELTALEQVVAFCNDDTCATELKEKVTQYYEKAQIILDDAETKPRNYVFVYLPILLAHHNFDSDLYVANYTDFLDDVTKCINNL